VPSKDSNMWSSKERGVLLIVVLLILLVTTILGVSAMKASGLEMQMSSNSREQLTTLEAAEYVIGQVTSEIHTVGGFSNNSLANADCGNLCFNETCSGGYCFFGAAVSDPLSWQACSVGLPALEPSRDPAVWAEGSGRHNTLSIPDSDVVAKYIIEFRCYAAIDDAVAMDAANHTHLYRITTLVSSTSGRSAVMLRVTIKQQ
jgi:type IV pilus assembly protein PilX